jgi:uncharacterized protein
MSEFKRGIKNLSFLIKPASGACNIHCRYCFYRDVADNREQASLGMMRPETSEALISAAYREIEPDGAVSFAFQGGEPTLAGLSYFEHFVRYAQTSRPPGVRLSFAIQTNGLLVDNAWASFFKRHHFLVGLSVDGKKEIHDALRADSHAKGTWQTAAKALSLLQKHKVEVNLLCVVSRRVARHPQSVYAALKKLGARYLQFIPCLDPLEGVRGGHAHSLIPEDYGGFLCGLFDAWYADWKQGRYVSVRLFDDYVHLFMGLPSGTCATSGACGGYFVVEGDGGLYPCDFYVLDAWRMGDVHCDTLSDIRTGPVWQRFQSEGMDKPPACTECRWYPVCRGGCKRDWVMDSGAHNYYCPAFTRFFEHASERLREMAQAERQARRSARL